MKATASVDAARARAAATDAPWFVQPRWDEAEAEARALDDLDRSGALVGCPLAVKANLAVAGLTTTAGSVALEDDPPAEDDATVVTLLRGAGAVVVGTANMDELAYGFTGRNARFGSVPNPHDPDRLPGGSSSASAATIAASVVPAALGTDTNGSIRVPAALCGVWGLRPTLGLLPHDGVVPLAPTLDTPGPLAATASLLTDLTAALGIDVEPRIDPAGARVRLVDGVPAEPATPAVRAGTAAVAAHLHHVGSVAVPWALAARAAAQLVTAVEGAAAHHEVLQSRAGSIGPLVRPRLRAGAVLEAAAYLRALRLRDRLTATVSALFADLDVLVLPTVATTAPAFDAEVVTVDDTTEPVNAFLGRATAPFSFLGLPALSVPLAEPDDDGLPVGVQLVGRWGDDALLLALARILERDGIAAAHVLR